MKTARRLKKWLTKWNRSVQNPLADTLQESWFALWENGCEEAVGMDIIN